MKLFRTFEYKGPGYSKQEFPKNSPRKKYRKGVQDATGKMKTLAGIHIVSPLSIPAMMVGETPSITTGEQENTDHIDTTLSFHASVQTCDLF